MGFSPIRALNRSTTNSSFASDSSKEAFSATSVIALGSCAYLIVPLFTRTVPVTAGSVESLTVPSTRTTPCTSPDASIPDACFIYSGGTSESRPAMVSRSPPIFRS